MGLALGKKVAPEEELAIKDPFNVKIGGLVNMQTIKSGKMKEVDDAYDVGIGTQFSAETNKRDEDEEMMKYIEQELQKRKGGAADENSNDRDDRDAHKYMSPEDAALYALPEHLRQSSSHRSEEMLSNQMLNGIPEVDLGIQAKIHNIEATEEAKQKLLQDAKNKKDGPSQFVPTNMAVNFMQHNRCKLLLSYWNFYLNILYVFWFIYLQLKSRTAVNNAGASVRIGKPTTNPPEIKRIPMESSVRQMTIIMTSLENNFVDIEIKYKVLYIYIIQFI